MERDGDLLFVYGTLKRGLNNHHQLGDAPFLGEVEMPGVCLHDLGPFPMAIAADGVARGELYGVDAERLAHLDRFEGVPRLYQRESRRLSDGRQAWIYLGQPRQVRHSPRLQGGCWPATAPGVTPQTPAAGPPLAWGSAHRCRAALLSLLAPLALLGVQSARAEASLAQCRRWQNSNGLEQILLGNAIGAAAYLTKVQRFADSDPQHPQLLYSPSDLQRACDGWR